MNQKYETKQVKDKQEALDTPFKHGMVRKVQLVLFFIKMLDTVHSELSNTKVQFWTMLSYWGE